MAGMTDTADIHLRALAADTEALQRRLHDALGVLDELTPTASFRLGEAFASLGSAARTLKEAARAQIPPGRAAECVSPCDGGGHTASGT